MSLRPYQREYLAAIYAAWQDPTCRNVMGVLPTGAGKTTCFSALLKDMGRPACVVAHRNELVSQAALALNREGVPHGIIAPKAVIQQIVRLEMETHGESHYSARAHVRVAGVNTLAARAKKAIDPWARSVEFVIMDEGHHVLRENIFGAAVASFPAARGLFPTAHAVRADGAGLGRSADGLVDRLVVGPSCRALIDRGYLSDYRLVCPPTDIDVSKVPISSTGDFSSPKLREAVHKSKTIVGDIAAHYLKFAAGKLGVTFVVDVEAAGEVAAAYRAVGVSAEVITAKTPIHIRSTLMRRFRNRELLQLVSVDVLGEGVDVPAIEVVSLARHTASFQLYGQQTGRALRLMISPELTRQWDSFTDDQRLAHIAASVKPKAIIIDHVGNWQRHGLPDIPREYSLERPERNSRKGPADAIPLRTCVNPDCLQPYERVLPACPYCGHTSVPAGRGTPEMVDGDLVELDPATLAALRGEIARIDGPARVPASAGPAAAGAILRNHRDRQAAQAALRQAIALWAGWQKHLGRGDSEGYKRFFFAFGTDVATAMTLGAREAEDMETRIRAELARHNVVEATA
jgi:superfamily II DNA or RNA helicase